MPSIRFGWTVRSTTETPQRTTDPYKDRAVLVIHPHEEGKATAIEINRQAQRALGVDRDNPYVGIAFDKEDDSHNVYIAPLPKEDNRATKVRNLHKPYGKISHKKYYQRALSELQLQNSDLPCYFMLSHVEHEEVQRLHKLVRLHAEAEPETVDQSDASVDPDTPNAPRQTAEQGIPSSQQTGNPFAI